MRILIGLNEVAGQIPLFADGFRKLGHQVTTVVYRPGPFTAEIEYDVHFGNPIKWPESIAKAKSPLVKLPRYLINQSTAWPKVPALIANHDIFIFQWAQDSLLPRHADYPIIKRLNKRIGSLFLGSDVRDYTAYQQWYGAAQKYLQDVPFQSPHLHKSLFDVRMSELYSDLILSVPNQAVLALRPYDHFFIPLDISAYPFNLPGREVPVVVHAPSKKDYKGTKYILRALDQLRSEGVLFELRFLDGIPHQQLKTEFANADVVIDEMFFPLHGKLTVEALASGCAVANGDRQDYEPFPPNRPIWYINPDNIYTQLKQLIMDRELRIQLAQCGRTYVEKYYDHIKVSERILTRLDSGISAKRDHYPVFFASNYYLPPGQTISNYLKDLTARVVRRWGLPDDLDPQHLVRRGLMANIDPSFEIPRWRPASLLFE